MKIYPHDYAPPVEVEPLVISAAQRIWVKDKLKDHMTNNTIGYELSDLVKYIHEEAAMATNKHYPFKLIEEVILELDAEWGWHPVVETSEEPMPVEELK